MILPQQFQKGQSTGANSLTVNWVCESNHPSCQRTLVWTGEYRQSDGLERYSLRVDKHIGNKALTEHQVRTILKTTYRQAIQFFTAISLSLATADASIIVIAHLVSGARVFIKFSGALASTKPQKNK